MSEKEALRPTQAVTIRPLAILFDKFILLWLGLFGVASCLLLNQSTETFMAILQAGVILHFIKDRQLLLKINRELTTPLFIILLPLGLNLLCQNELTKARYARELFWSLFIITGFWIISGGSTKKKIPWLPVAVIAVLCAFSVSQTGVFLLQTNSQKILPILQDYFSQPYLKAIREYVTRDGFAMFSNIHYYALFAVTTLPISIFCIRKQKHPIYKFLLSFCIVCELYLLLKTGSRPGWLALLLVAFASVPFVGGKNKFLYLSLVVSVPLILYYGDILGFKIRLNDLLFNLVEEERVTIWSDAWEMQKASDWRGWLIGHGLGSFSHYFKDYSHFKILFDFPHNFILEILFDSGIVTLITVIAGYILFYSMLISLRQKTVDQGHKSLALLLINVMTAQFIFTFLTIPFLTGRAILSLAIIVGAGIMLLRLDKQHA